ncbi:GGDEF domain-containing protein [Deinococcus sp. A31D244]|uniref:GGDEF domain-containing protein n=1 Tax=Deinococcus sp. A31D244 TaxID=3397675 RepID=UPI0039E0B18F
MLAALATAVNAAIMVYLLTNPDPLRQVGRTAPGLVISAGLLLLTLWPRAALHTLQRACVGILLLWFALNVQSVTATQRPITSGLLIHFILLALFCFTWLRRRSATLMVLAGYALLLIAAFTSRQPDVPGVLLAALTVPVIWYLTQYGLSVNRERVRSEALLTLATTDPLTGLLNRRAGRATLDAAVTAHAARPGSLCVALLDIDHFKRVNDTLGHQTGDRVLIAVADILNAGLPPGGSAIRWGGEEFLLILPDQTPAQAHLRLLDMLTRVRQLRLPGIQPVTLSGGLSVLSAAAGSDPLIDQADRSLYAAKAAGRDRLHTDQPGAQAPVSRP